MLEKQIQDKIRQVYVQLNITEAHIQEANIVAVVHVQEAKRLIRELHKSLSDRIQCKDVFDKIEKEKNEGVKE